MDSPNDNKVVSRPRHKVLSDTYIHYLVVHGVVHTHGIDLFIMFHAIRSCLILFFFVLSVYRPMPALEFIYIVYMSLYVTYYILLLFIRATQLDEGRLSIHNFLFFYIIDRVDWMDILYSNILNIKYHSCTAHISLYPPFFCLLSYVITHGTTQVHLHVIFN